MVAIVTGISQMDPAAGSSWLSEAVAGATALPTTSGTNTGIDGGNCEQFQNTGNALVIGTYYSLWSDNFATAGNGFDLSAVDQACFIYIRHTGPNSFFSYAANSDSVWFLLFSGGTSANWARFEHSGNGLNNGVWRQLRASGTPDATGGTFDDTDITGVGIAVEAGATSVFGFQLSTDQPLHVDGAAVFGDTGAAAEVTVQDYYDLMIADSGEVYHSQLFKKAGFAYESAISIEIQADDFVNDGAALGIAFKETDTVGFPAPPLGYFNLSLISQSGGTHDYGTLTAATNGVAFNLNIDGTNGTLDIGSFLAAGVNDVSIIGSNTNIVTASIQSPSSIVLGGVDANITITDSTAAVEWSSALSGGSLITDSDIDVTFDVGDYSSIPVTITASNSVTFDPTTDAGTYDVTSWVNTGFTTNFDIPSGNTNDTTVQLDPNFTQTITDPTAGGGNITIDNQVTVDVTVTVLDDSTGLALELAHVRVLRESDQAVILTGATNASGVITGTWAFSGDIDFFGWARQKDLVGTDYIQKDFSGTLTASGAAITVRLEPIE